MSSFFLALRWRRVFFVRGARRALWWRMAVLRSLFSMKGWRSVDILVSACLLGYSCRYDGGSKPCEAVRSLADSGHVLIPLCPEVEGGLPVPHAPCELRKTPDGVRAISIDGVDCTAQYEAGARIAVEKAQSSGARVAILKSKSPSCGCGTVFDGTFSGTLCEGWGIAAAALRDVGVHVVDENHVTSLGEEGAVHIGGV